MHEVLVNCLGGLSLSRKSVVKLTDSSAMTLDVYSGRKTTTQQLTGCLGVCRSLQMGMTLCIYHTCYTQKCQSLHNLL